MPEFIYLIYATGTDFIKIGISKNPKARLGDLHTTSLHKLRLVADGGQSQRKGRGYPRRGEWFEPLKDWIETSARVDKNFNPHGVASCGCILPKKKGLSWRHVRSGHALYEVSIVEGKRKLKYLRYYSHKEISEQNKEGNIVQ